MNYRQIIEHCEEATPLTMAAKLMCETVISVRQAGRLSDDEKQSLEHAIRIVLATQKTVERTRLQTLDTMHRLSARRSWAWAPAGVVVDETMKDVVGVLRIGFGLNGTTADTGDQWG